MLNKVTDRSLILDNLTFHYRDWGGGGAPIVLLHGLASTSHIWNLTAPLLAQNYRVVALDQRGHGTTAKPDGEYGYEAIVGDLRAFLQALGLQRPVVVGHSWGGNVALAYGASYPQEPRALVLLDGGTFDIQGRLTWEEALEELSPPPLAGMPLADFKTRMRTWMSEDLLTPEVEAAVLANFEIDAEGRIAPRLPRELHLRILRAMWEQRPGNLYPRVQCPVLILPARWQDRDDPERLAVKEQEVAAARQSLAQVEVVWLEESIHDVPLQRPRLLADTISQFIDRF
jgi:pimeloyl-ACP methyl ester carboxylesterase